MELEERIYSLVINEEKQEEIIALASIFEGDLEIVNADKATLNNNETIINIQMHPSEGGVKLSDQELRVTLTLEIIYGVETKLSIRNCKGLSNKRICEIESIVEKMQNQDEETIFDIIDIVKEKIDEMNQLPDGECPICLFPFERTNLYKAKCFHLFHMDCFTQFLFETLNRVKKENEKLPDEHKVSELIHCPVCREVLDVTASQFRKEKGKFIAKKDNRESKDKDYIKIAIQRQQLFSRQHFDKQKQNDGHFSETVNCLYIRPEDKAETEPEVEENKSSIDENPDAIRSNEESKNHVKDHHRSNNRGGYRGKGNRGRGNYHRQNRDRTDFRDGDRKNEEKQNGENRNDRGRGRGRGYRGKLEKTQDGGRETGNQGHSESNQHRQNQSRHDQLRNGPNRNRPNHDGPKRDGPNRDEPKRDRPKRNENNQGGPRSANRPRDGPKPDGPKRDGPKSNESSKRENSKHRNPKKPPNDSESTNSNSVQVPV